MICLIITNDLPVLRLTLTLCSPSWLNNNNCESHNYQQYLPWGKTCMLVWGLAWFGLTPSLALYFPWASLFPSPNFPSRVWKIFSCRLEEQKSRPVCWSEVWPGLVWPPPSRCTSHELHSFHHQTFRPTSELKVHLGNHLLSLSNTQSWWECCWWGWRWWGPAC